MTRYAYYIKADSTTLIRLEFKCYPLFRTDTLLQCRFLFFFLRRDDRFPLAMQPIASIITYRKRYYLLAALFVL